MSLLAGRIGLFLEKGRKLKHVMFNKYLFMTNVGISITLSGLGDVMVQSYSFTKMENKKWDVIRTRNMSVSGMTVGIVCHAWYQYLDRVLPGTTILTVMKKVVADQIVFSPVCLGVFFLTLGVLENSSLTTVCQEAFEKGKLLYFAEWIIWPPAQAINFYFIPNRYRILYDSTVSLGYDIYTSYVKNDIRSNQKTEKVQ